MRPGGHHGHALYRELTRHAGGGGTFHQGLSEYGFLAVSGPEYGYIPEYVAEYSSMIVH